MCSRAPPLKWLNEYQSTLKMCSTSNWYKRGHHRQVKRLSVQSSLINPAKHIFTYCQNWPVTRDWLTSKSTVCFPQKRVRYMWIPRMACISTYENICEILWGNVISRQTYVHSSHTRNSFVKHDVCVLELSTEQSSRWVDVQYFDEAKSSKCHVWSSIVVFITTQFGVDRSSPTVIQFRWTRCDTTLGCRKAPNIVVVNLRSSMLESLFGRHLHWIRGVTTSWDNPKLQHPKIPPHMREHLSNHIELGIWECSNPYVRYQHADTVHQHPARWSPQHSYRNRCCVTNTDGLSKELWICRSRWCIMAEIGCHPLYTDRLTRRDTRRRTRQGRNGQPHEQPRTHWWCRSRQGSATSKPPRFAQCSFKKPHRVSQAWSRPADRAWEVRTPPAPSRQTRRKGLCVRQGHFTRSGDVPGCEWAARDGTPTGHGARVRMGHRLSPNVRQVCCGAEVAHHFRSQWRSYGLRRIPTQSLLREAYGKDTPKALSRPILHADNDRVQTKGNTEAAPSSRPECSQGHCWSGSGQEK